MTISERSGHEDPFQTSQRRNISSLRPEFPCTCRSSCFSFYRDKSHLLRICFTCISFNLSKNNSKHSGRGNRERWADFRRATIKCLFICDSYAQFFVCQKSVGSHLLQWNPSFLLVATGSQGDPQKPPDTKAFTAFTCFWQPYHRLRRLFGGFWSFFQMNNIQSTI